MEKKESSNPLAEFCQWAQEHAYRMEHDPLYAACYEAEEKRTLNRNHRISMQSNLKIHRGQEAAYRRLKESFVAV